MKVRFTARAREDLLNIWEFIAESASEDVADAVYERIERSCRRLADFPLMGRARPQLGVNARSLVIVRWLAVYRVTTACVQIVRVIDGARDLGAIKWPAI